MTSRALSPLGLDQRIAPSERVHTRQEHGLVAIDVDASVRLRPRAVCPHELTLAAQRTLYEGISQAGKNCTGVREGTHSPTIMFWKRLLMNSFEKRSSTHSSKSFRGGMPASRAALRVKHASVMKMSRAR